MRRLIMLVAFDLTPYSRSFRRGLLIALFGVISTLSGCSDQKYEKLEISTSTWIGYSPLYYAYQKGWLEPLNIKLLQVMSLGENKNLFLSHRADAFVGTQYEYQTVKALTPSLKALLFFDRSTGGDMIMSNGDLSELKASSRIDVYLESDSVNLLLLKDFIASRGLDPANIRIINKDQAYIERLTSAHIERPTLFVTYAPFNIALEKNGFHELASTKDGLDLFVIDGLFAPQNVIDRHQDQFKALDELIARAIRDLNEQPHAYYHAVKPYLSDVSYDEFMALKKDIVWIHRTQDADVLNRIRQYGIEVQRYSNETVR